MLETGIRVELTEKAYQFNNGVASMTLAQAAQFSGIKTKFVMKEYLEKVKAPRLSNNKWLICGVVEAIIEASRESGGIESEEPPQKNAVDIESEDER